MKMKQWVAGLMLLAGWAQAQEVCRWHNVQQRFYRMRGSTNSLIESIFMDDPGGFAISNEEVGGVIVVDAAMDMMHDNWISQEHHRMVVVGEFQLIEPTDPACIPQTGQIWTYHDGDDGYWKPGHSWPPRFTVPEDNTHVVVDNLTGLMWTRNANAGTGTWDMAVGACYFTPRFGYEDWRLPTVREMESLIDLGAYNPALSLSHPFTNMAVHHWTSTGNINNTNQAWKISVVDGAIHSWARTNRTPAYWPVRTHTTGKSPVPKTGMTTSLGIGDDGDLQPGQLWPIPRFTIQSDTNLVFDNLWGRMWTRAAGIGTTDFWWQAVQQCNEYELGGHSDWRLPTRREGWSLIDYGRPSFLPEGHPFTGAPPSPIYWTSTSYHGVEPENNGWGLSGGILSPVPKGTADVAVWPVRGDW